MNLLCEFFTLRLIPSMTMLMNSKLGLSVQVLPHLA